MELSKGLDSVDRAAARLVPVDRLSLHMGFVAHQARAYSGFCGMKQLNVFLLPPGVNLPIPIYTPPKNTTQPDSSSPEH